jgi:hypothetical protein
MIDILFLTGALVLAVIVSMRNELIGGYRLLSWMKRQEDLLKYWGQKGAKEIERQAIQEILMACDRLRNIRFEEWYFKSTTLSLIKKIAFIYHSNAQAPIEQVRLGDVLEALREANQKILYFIRLPQIKYVTQFRVAQIFDNGKTSPNNPNDTMQNKLRIKTRFLERLILKQVVKLLLIQWMLLVGETALKVYSGKQEEV